MSKADAKLRKYVELLLEESTMHSGDAAVTDQNAADLTAEREQILESELYLDEHPEEAPSEMEAEAEQAVVKREMLKTAITRIENAARTAADFADVVAKWDKLEQNEARRQRDHELLRGDIPLDYGKAIDGAIFPAFFMEPKWKQLMSGNCLDLIHDCPFEMDELTADAAVSRLMRSLNDDHKEIFYWHFIRQLSCAEVGRIRSQSDRNIRKTRGVILRKLQKELAKILAKREQAGRNLTLRQMAFLERMANGTIDNIGNG